MGTALTLSVLMGVAPHSNGSSLSAEGRLLGPSAAFSASVMATNDRIAIRYSRKTTYGFKQALQACGAVWCRRRAVATRSRLATGRAAALAADQERLQGAPPARVFTDSARPQARALRTGSAARRAARSANSWRAARRARAGSE